MLFIKEVIKKNILEINQEQYFQKLEDKRTTRYYICLKNTAETF